MRAVILAAGRGSRVKKLTEDKPKCLIEFCGKPLLHWQLEALNGAGISEIAVVTGYLNHRIAVPGVTLFHNAEWAETNMVRSLICARSWLEAEETIVSYADIVYPADTVDTLKKTSGDLVIPFNTKWREVWDVRFSDPLADAETFKIDAAGKLLEIGKRPHRFEDVEGQYMGLLKFSPTGWRNVAAHLNSLSPETVQKMDMTTLLQRSLGAGIPISTVPVAGRWFEVDSEADLESYHALVKGPDQPW
jgi:choline kinase